MAVESQSDPSDDTIRTRRSPLQSLKWHIISIAFFSVIGLATFVMQAVTDANNEASLLEEIQSQSYPIQAHLLAAVHKLEFIHRELENAVITGDEDAALQTDELANEFRENLNAVGQLNSDPEIPALLARFEAYHEESRELAIELIDPYADLEPLIDLGRKNYQKYYALLSRLNEMQQKSNDDFATAIADATQRAADSVRFGIFAGVIIVTLVVAIAVLTANSIIQRIVNMVDKLKCIALEDGDLKVRLDVNGADEMTELSFWFNKIIAKLEHTSHEAENNILRLANTDELSGLRNRRYLMSWLQNRMVKNNRDDDFAIVFIDLDDFKPINDTYGHEAGDELIKQVARRIQNFIQSRFQQAPLTEDNADEYVTCRLGGDEFMLTLPSVTDRTQLAAVISDLCECICAPYELADIECEIGVSIGLSRYPIDGTDRGSLLDRADLAMYEAKRRGKRQFAFYERRLEQQHGVNNSLIQSLKKTSTKDELYLEYQPKILISNGTCLGAEALLRWASPEFGFVSPEVFIPLAEQNQLITQIDLWVLEQVCQQMRQWQETGANPGVIAVNLSAITLQKPDLTDAVAKVLQTYELHPNSLQLEITESTVLDITSRLTDTINDLRTLGVSIAMDDFGAGHSSLKLLINNQIDLVKLDKSLIDEITTSTRQQRIVQSIITLASSLGVSALAEGIERLDQLEYLRSVLCSEGQGFYFSLPLSAADYHERYLRPEIRKASGF